MLKSLTDKSESNKGFMPDRRDFLKGAGAAGVLLYFLPVSTLEAQAQESLSGPKQMSENPDHYINMALNGDILEKINSFRFLVNHPVDNSIDAIAPNLLDGDPLVREYAAQALARLEDDEVVTTMIDYVEKGVGVEELSMITSRFASPVYSPIYEKLLDSQDPNIIENALEGISKTKDPNLKKRVHQFLKVRNLWVSSKAVKALTQYKDPSDIPVLISLFGNHLMSGLAAADNVSKYDAEDVMPVLREYYEASRKGYVPFKATWPEKGAPIVHQWSNESERGDVMQVARDVECAEGLELLLRGLTDPGGAVRGSAAMGIRAYAEENHDMVLPYIEEATRLLTHVVKNDDSWTTAAHAADALVKLNGVFAFMDLSEAYKKVLEDYKRLSEFGKSERFQITSRAAALLDAIGDIHDVRNLPLLKEALQFDDPHIVAAAVKGLKHTLDPSESDLIKPFLDYNHRYVRQMAIETNSYLALRRQTIADYTGELDIDAAIELCFQGSDKGFPVIKDYLNFKHGSVDPTRVENFKNLAKAKPDVFVNLVSYLTDGIGIGANSDLKEKVRYLREQDIKVAPKDVHVVNALSMDYLEYHLDTAEQRVRTKLENAECVPRIKNRGYQFEAVEDVELAPLEWAKAELLIDYFSKPETIRAVQDYIKRDFKDKTTELGGIVVMNHSGIKILNMEPHRRIENGFYVPGMLATMAGVGALSTVHLHAVNELQDGEFSDKYHAGPSGTPLLIETDFGKMYVPGRGELGDLGVAGKQEIDGLVITPLDKNASRFNVDFYTASRVIDLGVYGI